MTDSILRSIKEKINSFAQWQRIKTTYQGHLQSFWLAFDVERCISDFDFDFTKQGWEQYNTLHDDSYFAVWVNATACCVLTYSEGAITLLECLSVKNFGSPGISVVFLDLPLPQSCYLLEYK